MEFPIYKVKNIFIEYLAKGGVENGHTNWYGMFQHGTVVCIDEKLHMRGGADIYRYIHRLNRDVQELMFLNLDYFQQIARVYDTLNESFRAPINECIPICAMNGDILYSTKLSGNIFNLSLNKNSAGENRNADWQSPNLVYLISPNLDLLAFS